MAEKAIDRRRQKQLKWHANGQCDICGDVLDTNSKWKCRKCLDKNRAHAIACRRKKGHKPKRRHFIMCPLCYELGHIERCCPQAKGVVNP